MEKMHPQLIFTVKTYNPLDLVGTLPPDGNLENITSQLEKQTVWIPTWPYPLKHGDTITVYGKQAIYLNNLIPQINNGGTIIEVNYYGSILENINPWTVVSDGNGTATELGEGNWEFVGPNDDTQNGWIYIKKFFPTNTTLQFNINWDTPDSGGCCDWTVISIEDDEPTGRPLDTSRVNVSTPWSHTITRQVNDNQWVLVGIYSTDTVEGPGYLAVNVEEV